MTAKKIDTFNYERVVYRNSDYFGTGGLRSMPEVSVIIPTYNRGDLISDTIDSVLAQSFQDFEILVVDDGSTDNTREVLKKYAGKITYLNIVHTGLPAAARNAGLKQAKGKYVAFLDSDDIWMPEKLAKQVAVLENYPEIDLVCSNAYIYRENEEQKKELYLKDVQVKNGNVFARLLKDNFIINSSVLVRRSAIDRTGAFSENPELRALEDYDLWLKIALDTGIYFMPEALLMYRDHGGSIRMQQTGISYINAMILIQQQLKPRILSLGDQGKRMKKLLEDIDYSMALYEYEKSLRLNNKTVSIGELAKLVMIRPCNLISLCRFIVIRLINREEMVSVINFVSPWTIDK